MAQLHDLTRCSLDELADEVCRTIDAFNAVQQRQVQAAGAARQRLAEQEKALDQRRDLIEAAAAQLQAETATAALFQLALVRGELDVILEGASLEEAEREKVFRRQVGYLFSLRRYLEGLAGRPMPETLASYYMPGGFDPHALVREALAEGARP